MDFIKDVYIYTLKVALSVSVLIDLIARRRYSHISVKRESFAVGIIYC